MQKGKLTKGFTDNIESISMGLTILSEVDKLIRSTQPRLFHQRIREDNVYIIVSPHDFDLINRELESMFFNSASRQSFFERNECEISYKGFKIIGSTLMPNNKPMLVHKIE